MGCSFSTGAQTPDTSLHQSLPVHAPDMDRQSVQQALPHAANPVLHLNPQVVPLQLATALAGGAGQGVQLVPQVSTELLSTHMPEQTCRVLPQLVATQVVPEQAVVAAGAGQSAHTSRFPHSA